MTDIDFAALVRLIRRARKQTQEELARDLDVTVGTMNGWENGKHRPVKAQRRRLVTMAEEMGLVVPGADRNRGLYIDDETGVDRFGEDEPSAQGGRGADEMDAASAAPSFLAISDAAIKRLGSDVQKSLERAKIDIAGMPVSYVISQIKREWQDVSQQLAPYQAPAPTKVFRLGAHLFAVQDSAATIAPGSGEVQ